MGSDGELKLQGKPGAAGLQRVLEDESGDAGSRPWLCDAGGGLLQLGGRGGLFVWSEPKVGCRQAWRACVRAPVILAGWRSWQAPGTPAPRPHPCRPGQATSSNATADVGLSAGGSPSGMRP